MSRNLARIGFAMILISILGLTIISLLLLAGV